MAGDLRSALGISIGATNLAAVAFGRTLTRKPVLTLLSHRPPEVGVPSENPLLDGYGLVITDFIDRLGDPAAIVAADGSLHRPELLLGDALRALAYAATGGVALPDQVGVSYPAHWSPAAVEAVLAGVRWVPEWSGGERDMSVLTDAAAALAALRANPGLPARGIMVMGDFGGTGSTISLLDVAEEYRPVAPAVRHCDFAGNRIDQALLNYVLGKVPGIGLADDSATSTIGSLAQLLVECRRAKEQLSTTGTAPMRLDLAGSTRQIQLTRAECDEVIRPALHGFCLAAQETLQRNHIRDSDLAAIALIGGGANIPLIAATLSQRWNVPIITAPQPHLTAAFGAALQTRRHQRENYATAVAAAAPEMDMTTMLPPATSTSSSALAWSQEADGDHTGIAPMHAGEYPAEAKREPAPSARPEPDWAVFDQFDQDRDESQGASSGVVSWYRRPVVPILGTALVMLALVATVMIALRNNPDDQPVAPTPSLSTAPVISSTDSVAPQSTSSSPPTSTPSPTTTTPPTTTTTTTTTPSTTTTTTTAPSTTTRTTAPSTTTTTTAPSTTTTTAPSPTSTSLTESRRFPRIFPRLPEPPPAN